jgi:hypothetical protein
MSCEKLISVDFDDTLDRKSVQEFIKEKIKQGFEIWIHTSRLDNTNAPSPRWNDDLFKVCEELNIPKNNVVFCNMTDKWEFIKEKPFILHLDDDWIELDLINKNTNTIGISVWGNSQWETKANKLLSHFID